MNVTVDNLGPCKHLLRIEVEVESVDKKFDEVTRLFRRDAKIPGFRPGKAPVHLVIKAYNKQIDDEVKKGLISDNYKEALEQEKLKAVLNPEIEEVEFGRKQSLKFIATVETEPDFTIPEYKKIPVKREVRTVIEDDVTKAIDALREQRAAFNDVERAVEADDYVVVNYKGTTEGKPLTELAPTAAGLAERENFWMHIEKDFFLTGFTDQLLNASKGDKVSVNVDFPENFSVKELANKPGVFDVEVVQVKEKKLPDFDDEFATQFGAENSAQLEEGVRNDLVNELNHKQKNAIRNQLIQSLISRTDFDLPETLVNEETRQVVYDIVNDNQKRGVPKDKIDESKDEIFNNATKSAHERVKVSFVINKVAELESIKASKEEITSYVTSAAASNNTTFEKMAKQIQERNAVSEIYERIVREKVLDFLELNAEIEDVLPDITGS